MEWSLPLVETEETDGQKRKESEQSAGNQTYLASQIETYFVVLSGVKLHGTLGNVMMRLSCLIYFAFVT